MPKIRIPVVTVICLAGLTLIMPMEELSLVLISVLLHESGHLAVMAVYGIGIEKITLLPIGIDIKRRCKYISYPKEAVLALAGAAVNITVFAMLGCRGELAYVNLLYALINLIPVKGLDGGNALEALLLSVLDMDRAQRVLDVLSFIFLMLLWMLGVYMLLLLNGNISIFALSVFLFVSVIMK